MKNITAPITLSELRGVSVGKCPLADMKHEANIEHFIAQPNGKKVEKLQAIELLQKLQGREARPVTDADLEEFLEQARNNGTAQQARRW